ncbi:MAG: DUF4214 domain-containing protein [Acidimicrobiales bacterium]
MTSSTTPISSPPLVRQRHTARLRRTPGLPRRARRAMSIAAVIGLCSSSLVASPSAGALTPAVTVNAVDGVASDGSFDIRHYEVSIDAGTAPEGNAALRTAATVEVDLAGAPQMLILDRIEGASTLELRSRNDGVWGEWIEIEVESDDAPDGIAGGEGSVPAAAGSVGPVWIGDGATAIQLSDPSGGLRTVRVEALTSLDVPAAANLAVADDPSISEPIVGNLAAARPTIRPRSDWATAGWAAQNEGCEFGPYYADSVRAVVVHHTVNTNDYGADQVDDLLRGIYRYHVGTRGWCDIAYNFVVDRFGIIWEARSGGTDEPVIGGHTRGFNTWTSGIAILGQHQQGGSPAAVDVSAATAASVQRLAAWKLGLYGVDPLGRAWLQNRSSGPGMKFAAKQWVEVPTILGHRDLGESSCPGSRAYPLVSGFRTTVGVTGQQIGTAPYVFPAWEGAESGVSVVVVDTAGGVRPAMGANVPDPMPTIGSGAVAIAGSGDHGYVLTSAGTLRPYGGAPAISGAPAGGATVVDLAVASGGGGWILTNNGDIVAFGGASGRSVSDKPANGTARAMALDTAGNGYVVASNGHLSPVGSAPSVTSPSVTNAIGVAMRPDGTSGWVLGADMSLKPFGGAPSLAVKSGTRSDARAILASATGYGGYVLDAEGRLLPFGDVPYAGPISTTVGQPIAVDASAVGYKLRPDLGTSDDSKLALALYRTFVGDTLAGPQLDHWTRLVDDDGAADVANMLAASDAWAGAVVSQIYTTALGRAPDAAGRAYWVEQLRLGMKMQELGTYFYGSSEYFAQAGSAGAYVDALYRELLHRDADPTGRAFWIDQIERRRARPADVSAGFYASLESRRDRVSGLFEKVLGRDTDPAGLDYWAEWLSTGDDIDLAAILAGSEEYIARATN